LAAGAQLIVVSSDTPKQLYKLKRDLKVDVLVLSDQDLTLIHRLEVREGKRKIARPAAFVLDKMGNVVWRHIGNHPLDRPSEGTLLWAVKKATKANSILRSTTPR
jgi:peroxiredoxin